ncbi:MAG: arsenate reductase (glutaredoxin) [Legionellaceae bacterium]|nr:arsenate reductase (glutaredoxin) [Legionellaceae bacterium]
MQKLTIYHNPRCSKSRETLAILQNQGIEFTAIEYLKTPLDIKQLKALRAHFSLKEFVRTHETVFKTLGLSLDDEQGVLNAMLDEPKLMQRPIVVYQNKAVIGRPPENVLALLKQ